MPAKWTNEFLDAQRLETDKLADDVAEQILAGGEPELRTVDELFQLLTENDFPAPERLPASVRKYFDDTAALPPWADPQLIAEGEKVFNVHGIWMVTALLLSSLPQCYAGARGAQVLHITGRMTNQFERRIVETAQFLLDVMSPGGLAPKGKGIRSTQKIRLIHAAIRAFMKGYPKWDPAWGKPVNQADLAATLCAFSLVTIDGVEAMGMKLTPAEEAAYFHAWRVVGHVLGISEQMLPSDVADARALWAMTKVREFEESDAGKELTGALLGFVHQVIPLTIFDGMGDVAVRLFVGDDTADLLGVQRRRVHADLLGVLEFFDHAVSNEEEEHAHAQAVVGLLSEHLVNGLEKTWRRGNRVRFEIPPSLRGSWGLEPTPPPGA